MLLPPPGSLQIQAKEPSFLEILRICSPAGMACSIPEGERNVPEPATLTATSKSPPKGAVLPAIVVIRKGPSSRARQKLWGFVASGLNRTSS